MSTREQIKNYYLRINELKTCLRETDYKRNKWIDGELTDEEWFPIREQCKAWRAEINALEIEILELRNNLL